ncbi:hypothetical protein AHF37_12792, partial [Paragonimus kellicotti]
MIHYGCLWYLKLTRLWTPWQPNCIRIPPRLLPDETLDSVCVALWTAVSAYNRTFASSKQGAFSEPVDRRSMPLSLPPLVTRIVGDEASESAVGSSTRDWNHIGAVLNELLERLLPVFRGIRGLSAFFTASANAQSLDS